MDKDLVHFSEKEWVARGKALAREYQSADPFNHIAIDSFLPATVLDRVLEEFSDPNQMAWKKFDDPYVKKLGSGHEEQLGPFTRNLLRQMNSRPILRFLEELTGIDKLIPDPYFEGGGLHQILPGGFLKVHADFNYYERLNLDRRVNILIFLNKDWEESYGGHLELWDSEMKGAKQKILPLFNRAGIFSTTSTSWHGHPEPLTCPPDRTRKSIALYYYTAGRPSDEGQLKHMTVFRKRQSDSDAVEDMSQPPNYSVNMNWKRVVKLLTPPIIFETLKKIYSRIK